MPDLDPYRLPHTAVPSAYRLRLEPDLDQAVFTGQVQIDVELTEPTDTIVLNAVALDLDAPVLATGAATATGTVEHDEEHERAILRFPTEVATGSHTLSLDFRGILNDELVGFYRSTFTDVEGATRTIATTQFEATDARRAFPCFDEPSFKATFEVTLVVPAGLGAYSNSRAVEERELPDGRREVRYATTMRMSTYLVAFVVGPFESSDVVDVDGVPLAVVYPPGKGHLADFALDVGAFALRFFHDYFDLPYPGDKVDLVAIPDFAYGAMENLGCVTFREAELLVDPAAASQNELVRIAMVISHELAHMWFGDLVTMAWWEGLWLNEAFATYMQYVCTDAYKPEWKMWVRFSGERELGLTIDGLHTTRPIEFPVHAPSEAMAMADPITYQKGGSVLKMLEAYLGADTFRDGIRHYLRAHAYANTQTSDLWAALGEVSGEPVGEVMGTWISQGGHPTVTVGDGTLEQAPFMVGPADGPSNIGGPWKVPVTTRTLGGGAGRQLLEDPAALEVPPPAVVNAGGAGFYRTSYQPAQLAAVAARLDELTEIERAVLLGDTWALARAGQRRVADVLALAGGLGPVVEPAAYDVVDRACDFLNRVAPDDLQAAVAARTRTLLEPLFERLGWERAPGEDERAQVLRATVVRRLGTSGEDEAIRAEAVGRFDAGLLDGDLGPAIVAIVATVARPGTYEEFTRRFAEAKDPLTEERFRQGIAGLGDTELCLRAFDECFELFRMQDAPIVVARLMMNPIGGRAVWERVTERWDELIAKVPSHMHFVLGIGLSGQVADAAFAQRAVAFHRAHPIEQGQQRIDQALEMLVASSRFADRERPTLAATLAG